MMNVALRAVFCLGVCLAVAGFSSCNAEEPDAVEIGIQITARQLRGKGIHAFRDGDLDAAERYLTQAVTMCPTDAFTLYCRGLVYLRQGRRRTAEYDFTHGALVEQSDLLSRHLAVTKALQAIQNANGFPRDTVEEFRSGVQGVIPPGGQALDGMLMDGAFLVIQLDIPRMRQSPPARLLVENGTEDAAAWLADGGHLSHFGQITVLFGGDHETGLKVLVALRLVSDDGRLLDFLQAGDSAGAMQVDTSRVSTISAKAMDDSWFLVFCPVDRLLLFSFDEYVLREALSKTSGLRLPLLDASLRETLERRDVNAAFFAACSPYDRFGTPLIPAGWQNQSILKYIQRLHVADLTVSFDDGFLVQSRLNVQTPQSVMELANRFAKMVEQLPNAFGLTDLPLESGVLLENVRIEQDDTSLRLSYGATTDLQNFSTKLREVSSRLCRLEGTKTAERHLARVFGSGNAAENDVRETVRYFDQLADELRTALRTKARYQQTTEQFQQLMDRGAIETPQPVDP